MYFDRNLYKYFNKTHFDLDPIYPKTTMYIDCHRTILNFRTAQNQSELGLRCLSRLFWGRVAIVQNFRMY